MQFHIGVVKNIAAGIFLTVTLMGLIIARGHRSIQRKMKRKIRNEEDLSLIKQTREQFERLLAKNLTFPIAMV